MKKIFLIVLLLAGAAGAVLYFNRAAGPVADDYYADYLPQDTLAVVSLIDLKGLSESFPASTLGKFLAKPTVHGMLTELGTQPEAITEYDSLYDGLAGVMTNPAFRQVFGDDAVVAVLSPDAVRLQSETEQELRKSLLVFGTSSVSGALDSFARLMMSKNVTRESVEGLDVTRIQLEKDEVIYGYTDGGIMILAYEPTNIAAAVKRKQAGGGLQESTLYATVKEFWAQAAGGREYAGTYLNFSRIRSLLTASPNEDGRQLAKYFQGFKAMGSVIFDRTGELHVTSRIDYDSAALNDLVKKQYQAVSKENISLGLLTPKTLLYYWGSLIDKNYIRGLLSATDDEQYRKVNARVQQELGLSLDEVIGAVGPQAGLVVNEIVNTGLFPLPKVVLFLQVRKHDVALKIVDRLRKDIADRGFAAEQSETVNGHTIYYWSMLPGEATQPAFVLTDTMIYVANGKSALTELIGQDAAPAVLPTAMAENLGDELVKKIDASNYTTFVLRPALLATQIKEAADWLTGMLAASNGVSAEQLKQEILKMMQSIDVVTATSTIEKEFAVSSLVLKHVPVKAEK